MNLAPKYPKILLKNMVFLSILGLTNAFSNTILTIALKKKEFRAKWLCLISHTLVILNLIFEKDRSS